MKAARNAINILINSNIYIGCCAVALVFTNQIVIDNEIHFNYSCWFIFSVTVFTYSYLKRVGLLHDVHGTNTNPQLARNILLLSLASSTCFFFTLPGKAEVVFLILLVVTGLVGFVEIPFVKPRIKLRDLGLVRIVFVAIAWSVATVIIPLSDYNVRGDLLLFLLLRSFLFLLAITMAFDVKDMQEDKQNGLETLPLAIGVSNTKLIAQAILFLLLSINTAQYFFFHIPFTNMMAINLSVLLAIVIIQIVEEETPDWMYYFGLDGLLLIQFLFVYAGAKYLG